MWMQTMDTCALHAHMVAASIASIVHTIGERELAISGRPQRCQRRQSQRKTRSLVEKALVEKVVREEREGKEAKEVKAEKVVKPMRTIIMTMIMKSKRKRNETVNCADWMSMCVCFGL